MNLSEAREMVLGAFEPASGSYRHVYPYKFEDFIDGAAWVGMLCGAALIHGDKEIAVACERYLDIMLKVGVNARNFALQQVTPDWKLSYMLQGYWYREKKPYFAGPLGIAFAVRCGAVIPSLSSSTLVAAKLNAKMLTWMGSPFGWLVNHITGLRQHVNTMWRAYLALGKKPPNSMLWMCEENPLFSYIAGIKCSVPYPPIYRTTDGKTVERDTIVPLSKRKPSAWIFRDWPYTEYVPEGEQEKSGYVPIWQVVGEYLQASLEK